MIDDGYTLEMLYPINCYPKMGYYPLDDGFSISKKNDYYKIVIGPYRDFKEWGNKYDDLDLFKYKVHKANEFTIKRKSSESIKLSFNGYNYQFTYRYTTLRWV